MTDPNTDPSSETKSDAKARTAPLDPVAETMLAHLAGLPPEKSAAPDDVARAYAEIRRKPSDGRDLFKRYRNAVKQQAIYLARQGRVEILRKGEPVDPDDFKGVWRLRLKRTASSGLDDGGA